MTVEKVIIDTKPEAFMMFGLEKSGNWGGCVRSESQFAVLYRRTGILCGTVRLLGGSWHF